MKRIIIILVIMLLPTLGLTAFAQQQPAPTKEQIEARLKQVQIEKRYLELQVEEQNLQNALKEIANPKAEAPKPAEAKKEKAK
jgi:hypothetical protein